MRGLPSILSLFHNEINKFNNLGAQMLDSIYHMTLKLIKNHIFCWKMSRFCNLMQRYNGCHYIYYEICKPLVVYRFYCMSLYHSQTQCHVINTLF